MTGEIVFLAFVLSLVISSSYLMNSLYLFKENTVDPNKVIKMSPHEDFVSEPEVWLEEEKHAA